MILTIRLLKSEDDFLKLKKKNTQTTYKQKWIASVCLKITKAYGYCDTVDCKINWARWNLHRSNRGYKSSPTAGPFGRRNGQRFYVQCGKLANAASRHRLQDHVALSGPSRGKLLLPESASAAGHRYAHLHQGNCLLLSLCLCCTCNMLSLPRRLFLCSPDTFVTRLPIGRAVRWYPSLAMHIVDASRKFKLEVAVQAKNNATMTLLDEKLIVQFIGIFITWNF